MAFEIDGHYNFPLKALLKYSVVKGALKINTILMVLIIP